MQNPLQKNPRPEFELSTVFLQDDNAMILLEKLCVFSAKRMRFSVKVDGHLLWKYKKKIYMGKTGWILFFHVMFDFLKKISICPVSNRLCWWDKFLPFLNSSSKESLCVLKWLLSCTLVPPD